ncbi:MAG: hypothetical protein IKI30_03850 [Oxalobacter sp.]|nr:hypothetical protein [Oxalobacter sp.]
MDYLDKIKIINKSADYYNCLIELDKYNIYYEIKYLLSIRLNPLLSQAFLVSRCKDVFGSVFVNCLPDEDILNMLDFYIKMQFERFCYLNQFKIDTRPTKTMEEICEIIKFRNNQYL